MYSIAQPQQKQQKNQNVVKKTLDIQHNHKLMSFQERETLIKDLKKQIADLEMEHNKYIKAKSETQLSDEEVIQMIQIQDSILGLEKQLKELQKQDDEIDYLTNTATILFKYYDILEKGNQQEDQMTLKNMGNNSILKYFVNKQKDEPAKETEIDPPQQPEIIDRASLLEKYMECTESNYVRNIDCEAKDKCPHCESSNRSVIINDGIVHCNNCHTIEHTIIDHDRPSYKDPPHEISYFAYKRMNHLNEWISQIQGKETTDIPEEIYDKILFEIKKQKITNMATLTCSKIKEILKRMRANKYYEHSAHIINKLNGLPSPHFDPELEEKLRSMFRQIQPLFLKYAPALRKNFLSYSYVLHKFVQLLGRDEYLPYFSLLKSREKLHQQDMIWKKICEELNWQYIPSI